MMMNSRIRLLSTFHQFILQMQAMHASIFEVLHLIYERNRQTVLSAIRYRRRRRSSIINAAVFLRTQKLRKVAVPRRFWVRPGKTNMWWQGFAQNIVTDEQWRDNFRMDNTSFYKLCDERRPYLTKQLTNMRQVVSAEEQVAMTIIIWSSHVRSF